MSSKITVRLKAIFFFCFSEYKNKNQLFFIYSYIEVPSAVISVIPPVLVNAIQCCSGNIVPGDTYSIFPGLTMKQAVSLKLQFNLKISSAGIS